MEYSQIDLETIKDLPEKEQLFLTKLQVPIERVESWDDENARKGYCLYKIGCRRPVTYNACGVMRWNNGVSFPIQSGHPCIGCSEANFWDNGPFYQHLPKFPGFGIETTADKVGMVAGAVTIAGIAAHAVTTNIRKRRLIRKGTCGPEETNES